MAKRPNVIEQLLDPVSQAMTPEVAEKLVKIRADARLMKKVEKLAEKCNQGELTPEEYDEYQAIVHTANVVAILQAKARLMLGLHARH